MHPNNLPQFNNSNSNSPSFSLPELKRLIQETQQFKDSDVGASIVAEALTELDEILSSIAIPPTDFATFILREQQLGQLRVVQEKMKIFDRILSDLNDQLAAAEAAEVAKSLPNQNQQ